MRLNRNAILFKKITFNAWPQNGSSTAVSSRFQVVFRVLARLVFVTAPPEPPSSLILSSTRSTLQRFSFSGKHQSSSLTGNGDHATVVLQTLAVGGDNATPTRTDSPTLVDEWTSNIVDVGQPLDVELASVRVASTTGQNPCVAISTPRIDSNSSSSRCRRCHVGAAGNGVGVGSVGHASDDASVLVQIRSSVNAIRRGVDQLVVGGVSRRGNGGEGSKTSAGGRSRMAAAEWGALAVVLDRFFFGAYLIIIVISLVVLFPRPQDGREKKWLECLFLQYFFDSRLKLIRLN